MAIAGKKPKAKKTKRKRATVVKRADGPTASATEKALNQVDLEIRKLRQKREQLLTRAVLQQEARACSMIKQEEKKKAQEVWRILGEGDSWIRYTCGFGVMHHLAWMLDKRAACVNIGASSATMERMMKLPARRKLDNHLRNGIEGKPWDALVFSGGGNDFAGDEFVNWLVPYAGQTDPATAIDEGAFAALLGHLASLYRQLGALVSTLSPSTHVFVCAYDFAIPDGRKVPFSGPWLKPGFDDRNYLPVNLAFRTAVVRIMLTRFESMISSVSADYPFIHLVRTQGTLPPGASSWDNELHPTEEGFKAITRKLITSLESILP